jgi:hypothetical protein
VTLRKASKELYGTESCLGCCQSLRSEILEKFSVLYGNPIFDVVFKISTDLILKEVSPIHILHPINYRFVLILFSHLSLDLAGGPFPSGFLNNNNASDNL